jgi:hypothetical protein
VFGAAQFGDEPNGNLAGSPEVADALRDDGQGQLGECPDAQGRPEPCERQARSRSSGAGWWRSEPGVGRVAHGVPARVDRLAELGNAVVPAIPEMIGRAILAAERAAAPAKPGQGGRQGGGGHVGA